jgi:hypothetical protein
MFRTRRVLALTVPAVVLAIVVSCSFGPAAPPASPPASPGEPAVRAPVEGSMIVNHVSLSQAALARVLIGMPDFQTRVLDMLGKDAAGDWRDIVWRNLPRYVTVREICPAEAGLIAFDVAGCGKDHSEKLAGAVAQEFIISLRNDNMQRILAAMGVAQATLNETDKDLEKVRAAMRTAGLDTSEQQATLSQMLDVRRHHMVLLELEKVRLQGELATLRDKGTPEKADELPAAWRAAQSDPLLLDMRREELRLEMQLVDLQSAATSQPAAVKAIEQRVAAARSRADARAREVMTMAAAELLQAKDTEAQVVAHQLEDLRAKADLETAKFNDARNRDEELQRLEGQANALAERKKKIEAKLLELREQAGSQDLPRVVGFCPQAAGS